MQSIGERLEEARKRKGISLREAAEVTKIRSDFLGYIEQNKMDFELPEIYKRGFLKNYARYLKLDVDKIMTDYNAQQLSNSRLGKKGGSEWFGQMEIKKTESEATNERSIPEESSRYGHISAKPSRPEKASQAQDEEEDSDKTFYIKIGLIFVGTLALVFVVFGLLWSILGSNSADELENDAVLGDPAEQVGAPIASTTNVASNNSITLTASGTVYVLVKQQADNKELYRKTMIEGETITLEKEGPVDILFTAGKHLVIEQGGERFRPNTDGTAKITLK